MNKTLYLLLIAGICLISANRAGCEDAKPLPWVHGSTTLAVLPDTERYSDDYPHLFEAQTNWVLQLQKKRSIAYVIHLGDVTQHNVPAEWELAKRCFGMLNGLVPYALTPGNHDYSGSSRSTLISEYFSVGAMQKWPTFGGVFQEGKLENSYHLFRINGRDWIALVLEFGPRDEVVKWANKVLGQYSNRLAILVTHAYLFRGNTRYDHLRGQQRASPHGWGNDGEALRQKLVRRHPNMMIVLSGHVSTGGLGYLASEGGYGNTMHQIMVDYEKEKHGGMAYMRLMEFLPDGEIVQVKSYSPYVKGYKTDPGNQFTFKLNPATRKKPTRVRPIEPAHLSKGPIHRYSFDGTGGDGTKITDSIGTAHGVLQVNETGSRLNGDGQVVLTGNGIVGLPPKMLAGLEDISFEIWFTPIASSYNWNSVVRFGGSDDWLTYVFRSLNLHRAEIAVNRHNEDIQRHVPVEIDKPMQVVVTYDEDGANGEPLMAYFRNGECFGQIHTSVRLTDVNDSQSKLGPFTSTLDELRVYDYPLSLAEVRGNFAVGPERLRVAAEEKPGTDESSVPSPDFHVQLNTIRSGFDKKTCWVHARAGVIPGPRPKVVMTLQKLLLTGSDVFYALNEIRTDDLGRSWSGPMAHEETLGRRDEDGGVVVAACDWTPKWHAVSGRLLGIGQTVRYQNNRVMHVRNRETAYAVYDPETPGWSHWKSLKMPEEEKFKNVGAGSVQRYDRSDGDILLPVYFKEPKQKAYSVTVLRCSFDGQTLRYLEHGSEHSVPVERGLCEPSLTRFEGRYYLTLRNDQAGHVTSGRDGLHYAEPKKWRFDDGQELGNYNTQQHWVTHSDALFLVYTRKGAGNDHVFRHRAPLFIAQVDPEKLQVIRRTEQILVPERGARLGNFGVTEVNERETWVTVTEWMQTKGPNPYDYRIPMKYGSDNAVFAARILWRAPNRLVSGR
jgi:hypothetical protein